MSGKERVSVIIPAYNREKYISEAIDSVLAQTYPIHEIIIIDDGSTDDTRKIVKKKYKEKVILLTQKNKGPSAARNAGIKKSTGNLICFLDSDDYWEKEKVAEQVKLYLKKNDPKIGIIDCYTRFVNLSGKQVGSNKFNKDGNYFEKLLIQNIINSTSSVMIPRAVLLDVGMFDESLKGVEDRELWVRISSKYSIVNAPMYLVICRRMKGSISWDYKFMRKYSYKVLNIYFNEFSHLITNKKKVISFTEKYYLQFYFRDYQFERFRDQFYYCVRVYPRVLFYFRKEYLFYLLSFLGESVVHNLAKLFNREMNRNQS